MPRYAAIDIGSNSIRMEAAEVIAGTPPRILTADREVTRLGASVFREGRISEEAMVFVSQVLARMGETIQRLDVVGVRAVATSAVRDASNQEEFVRRATVAAGTPVEIISGLEEARLIHMGVQTSWPHPKQRVLIVDIGGGSAEIISGDQGVMEAGISRPLGAVRLTEIFMKSDPPSSSELQRMMLYIDEKLDAAVRKIGVKPIDRAIGTSATAAAIVCAVNRIPRARRDEASRLRATTAQVRKFFQTASKASLMQRRTAIGIGPRRAEIIIPGAAVLLRVLETFQLPAVYYSSAGVRDGIIADLAARGVGRERSHLVREQAAYVESMARRYAVPLKHARKVAALAHSLFEGFQPLHRLPPENGKLLEAAAYMLDVGHFISATGHHKHSAYIVQNSDLPGFTDHERMLIAMLCRFHRKSMPASRHQSFQTLSLEDKQSLTFLIPLLRIADGLDTDQEQKVQSLEFHTNGNTTTVGLVADGDVDLNLWAAEVAADTFRGVYNHSVQFVKSRRSA